MQSKGLLLLTKYILCMAQLLINYLLISNFTVNINVFFVSKRMTSKWFLGQSKICVVLKFIEYMYDFISSKYTVYYSRI